ncbi:hypothetical protein MUS1_04055 [Marinomonas ushuaiensis DSM 15871]|uniref:Uncharacterized protein n=1 Tax=Marinomonas ushuaiensis DSM 15871 TaxID=1122207 RepID=X7E2P8_9GAMM|nr:hypothetical protein MUS1_04055 [Marinomonas ushuaiensis DSM 15871]
MYIDEIKLNLEVVLERFLTEKISLLRVRMMSLIVNGQAISGGVNLGVRRLFAVWRGDTRKTDDGIITLRRITACCHSFSQKGLLL